jgi:hypothetical protein
MKFQSKHYILIHLKNKNLKIIIAVKIIVKIKVSQNKN